MKFIKTCNWCPEQYDIFDEEKQVAYMRVKYGICECYVPDADGTIVYLSYIKGRGEFIDDEERQLHFKNAAKCIQNYYDKKERNEE